ncbi:unnamed protein product [Pleuronectes platessa]|uniref:Uncharacterized protein n=1 Tax=Pleuronectes platessa TaxID=8262 RepID=A0A9N7YNX4_PLEPL|nr:unnamed protein product [Pleuronectes platessa]
MHQNDNGQHGSCLRRPISSFLSDLISSWTRTPVKHVYFGIWRPDAEHVALTRIHRAALHLLLLLLLASKDCESCNVERSDEVLKVRRT